MLQGVDLEGADLTTGLLELALAADDAYAMPLGACLASIRASTEAATAVRIHVLDGGLSTASTEQLIRAAEGFELTVYPLDDRLSAELPVSAHISRLTYARLLIPEVLPKATRRIIYLDVDTIVRRDLSALWQHELNGALLGAVQDQAVPFFDCRTMDGYAAVGPFLAAVEAFHNLEQLALPGDAPYFNAGVMLIDLEQWRAKDISRQCFEFLREHRGVNKFWDQDALNAVCHRQWARVDSRWNQQSHLHRYPTAGEAPLSPEEYRNCMENPYVVHYSAGSKPWHFSYVGPQRQLFFTYVDQSPYAGWRPRVAVRQEWLQTKYQLRMLAWALKQYLLNARR
ncbi:MAG: glycosyltransferase family 8 protein [Bdellovibrionales bacterium]|nr:glycosyltransferase family 8 protein [Bdellovibrionales bacterium]